MSVAIGSPVAGTATSTTGGPRRSARWPWVLFAIAAGLSIATILYFGRGTTFFFDEWIWAQRRRDPSLDTLLQPYNGHFSAVPVAIYQLLFRLFGLTEYTPFRVLVACFHVGTIALVFTYVRHRIAIPAALAVTVVLLFFGAGWQDQIWPFQIGFLLSVAAGIGAFLLLDAQRLAADRGAMVCLALSLASSAIGIPVAIGLVVDRAVRRDWRRWWVVGVPLVLFAAWYAAYGEGFGEPRGAWPRASDPGPIDVVRFAFEAAGSAVGALVGLESTAGQFLLAPTLAILVFGWMRADAPRRARLLALVALLGSYWISLGITRFGIGEPTTSRYLYPAAVFVVLLLADCLRGIRVPTVAVVALVAVAAWSLVWNADLYEFGRSIHISGARNTRAELGGIYLGVRGVDAEYEAGRPRVEPAMRAWVSAFDALGFPGLTRAEIEVAPDRYRRRADAFLVKASGVHLDDAGTAGGTAPIVRGGGVGTAEGPSCVVVRPSGGSPGIELGVRTPALRIEALGGPVDLRLRKFADGYFAGAQPWALLHTGEVRGLWLPTVDGRPWTLGVATATRARVCGVTDPPT